MLQHDTFPTANRLSTHRAAAVEGSARPGSETNRRVQRAARGAGRAAQRAVGDALWLPDNLRAFLLFTLALAAVTGCLVLHLSLSVDILRIEQQIDVVRAQRADVERHNAELTFQISEISALTKMEQRAQALGFVNLSEQYYVALDSAPNSTPNSKGVTEPAEGAPTQRGGVPIAATASDQPAQPSASQRPNLLSRLLAALDFRPSPASQAMR